MQSVSSANHQVYLRAAGAVAFIAVVNADGDESTGSCFHIGEGIFVTARHVVDELVIKTVATTKTIRLAEETGGRSLNPRQFTIVDGPHYPPDDRLDIAIFKVELAGISLPRITVSDHTEYDLGEHELILSDIVIIGYPRVPHTTVPVQVATAAQINAIVRTWHTQSSHFIVSSMARGGFSGGVALDRSGVALGLVTESLGEGTGSVETGYMSVLSIAPAVDLAIERYAYSVHGMGPGRYSDNLIGFRLQLAETTTLTSYVYDAHIIVFDDNRDVFVQFTCDDEDARQAAIAAFRAVTPLGSEQEGAPEKGIFLPVDNPSPKLLITAAEAACKALQAAGYKEVVSDRSTWQVATWTGP